MTSKRSFGLIYQIFLGRQEPVSILDHPGKVLLRLAELDWQKLSVAGFDTVYLTGLWDNNGPIVVNQENGIDLENKENRTASAFALSNHRKVLEKLGTEDELTSLVDTLHQHRLRVIVDFIPNHTGLAHLWLKTHPEYYCYDEYGELIREFSGDVVKLNYADTGLRQEMLMVLNQIGSMGIDGVRVDMAHLIPIDFWREAIDQNQGLGFIAEAYSTSVFDWEIYESLLKVGYAGVYHEFLFRNVRNYFIHQISAEDLSAYVNFFLSRHDREGFVSYLMNHDDVLDKKVQSFIPALTCLLVFMPGMMLVYQGQLLGLSRRLAHHWIDILETTYDELMQKFPGFWLALIKIRDKKGLQLSKFSYVDQGVYRLDFESKLEIVGYINLGQGTYNKSLLKLDNHKILWQLQHSDDLLLLPGSMILAGV